MVRDEAEITSSSWNSDKMALTRLPPWSIADIIRFY